MNEYWDLFWVTGMPEAWVMSRRADERPPAAPPVGASVAPAPEDRAGRPGPGDPAL